MCKILHVGILLLLLCTTAFGDAEYGKWRWSDQPIMQMPDASAMHFTASLLLADKFSYTTTWWKADLMALGVGLVWEVKDGLVPYEKAGILGGEGFSTNDLIMDASGIIFNRVGSLIWNRIKYKKWSFGKVRGG